MNIGDRIKQKRTALGMKQIDLAKAAEVSRPSITSWENSDKQPGSQFIIPLSKALKVSAEWLLTGIDVMPPQLYLGGPVNEVAFLECYELFEEAVMMGDAKYPSEVKSQCLVKMYYAALEGSSPARAMLQYLTSLTPQE